MEDGWSEEVQNELEPIFDDLQNLMYEVRNCVRGYSTSADTNDELAEYITNLAGQLMDSAATLKYLEDASEDGE